MKYLLTDGTSTDKTEYYILDLFKLYFEVGINEIPNSDIGFNNILTNVTKDQLKSTITDRLNSLILKLQSRVTNVKISLENLEVIDESTVKLVISANKEVETYQLPVTYRT